MVQQQQKKRAIDQNRLCAQLGASVSTIFVTIYRVRLLEIWSPKLMQQSYLYFMHFTETLSLFKERKILYRQTNSLTKTQYKNLTFTTKHATINTLYMGWLFLLKIRFTLQKQIDLRISTQRALGCVFVLRFCLKYFDRQSLTLTGNRTVRTQRSDCLN